MLTAIPLADLRITAMCVGLFSAASFIVVAVWVGGYGAEINRIVVADVIASVFLAEGLAAALFVRAAQKGANG